MQKREYRLVKKQGLYYPEVLEKPETSAIAALFGFGKAEWQRIGIHPDGEFGLYDNYRYGRTESEARKTIEDYKLYIKRKESGTEIEIIPIE